MKRDHVVGREAREETVTEIQVTEECLFNHRGAPAPCSSPVCVLRIPHGPGHSGPLFSGSLECQGK